MIGVPIVEIIVFIEVGGFLGLWPTIGIVILTAIIGTGLLRLQGLATLYGAHESLLQNRFPIDEVFDGLCLILAGALLLTPGFITDAVGLLLFTPPLRVTLRQLLARYIVRRGHVHIGATGTRGGSTSNASTVIDGEFDDLTPTRKEKDSQAMDKR